jgi:hypothetical protein
MESDAESLEIDDGDDTAQEAADPSYMPVIGDFDPTADDGVAPPPAAEEPAAPFDMEGFNARYTAALLDVSQLIAVSGIAGITLKRVWDLICQVRPLDWLPDEQDHISAIMLLLGYQGVGTLSMQLKVDGWLFILRLMLPRFSARRAAHVAKSVLQSQRDVSGDTQSSSPSILLMLPAF